MAKVKDLLKGKRQSSVYSIRPDASVMQATKMLSENNIGALMVISDDGLIKGILSERDIVRKLDLRDCTVADVQVSEIMTEKILYIGPDQPLETCMAIMIEKNIRHLPVMENDVLIGVISVRDVLRTIIQEQKIVISYLENYIRGN